MKNQTEIVLSENSRQLRMVSDLVRSLPKVKPIVVIDGYFCLNPKTLNGRLCSHVGKKQSSEHIANRTAVLRGKKRSKPAWNSGVPNSSQSERQKKEANPNWKGGVSVESPKFRQSSEYKTWRKAVFTRDNFKCVECGAHNFTGGKRITFHVDHIKPYALHPELRLDINNGRTLCLDCHKKTPTYGFSKEYKAQIEDFKQKNQLIN